MKEEIGIAMIGCGRIGRTHGEALMEVKQRQGGVRLVAAADPAADRAEQCARSLGAEFHYLDHREALANPAVDAVVLALPNHLHAPITIEAAAAGKHILVEKPMAIGTEEADQMVAAAEREKVNLMVGQSRRYIKALFTAWERLDEIGKPISATYVSLMKEKVMPVYWKSKKWSGHLVYSSLGSHTLDYLLWLFSGKKPVRVYSEGYSNMPESEGFDEASVLIGFDDGAIASTALSQNNPGPRIERVSVIGTKGTMHMEHSFLPPSGGRAMVGAFVSRLILNERMIWDGVQEEGPFAVQMTEFVNSIREGRRPLADGCEVRRVMPIIEAADLSAERHEVIRL
jgi:predicted dehydrogenase